MSEQIAVELTIRQAMRTDEPMWEAQARAEGHALLRAAEAKLVPIWNVMDSWVEQASPAPKPPVTMNDLEYGGEPYVPGSVQSDEWQLAITCGKVIQGEQLDLTEEDRLEGNYGGAIDMATKALEDALGEGWSMSSGQAHPA